MLQAQPKLVKDIYPNLNQGTGEPIGSNLTDFVNVNSTVYFIGADGTHGKTLWKTNGTSQGTMKVAPGKIFGVSKLTIVNGVLYFIAYGGTGDELWKTDGTSQGTMKVAPGKAINISNLTNVNGTLFFSDNVYQLWKSNGTLQGTIKIEATLPGAISELQKVGNILFFTVHNYQSRTNELWKSNGTNESTVKLAEGFSYGPYNSTSYNNLLFFVAYDSVTGRNYFWKSDGTEAGTIKVAPDKIAAAYSFVEAFGNLFFVGNEVGTGVEFLWKTDGTSENTLKVAPGKIKRPSNFVLIHNKLFFTAFEYNNTSPYSEIWTTDGTDAGTTKAVQGKAYFANSLTDINGIMFFNAYDPSAGGSGYELWKSDGTTEGTTLVKDIVPGWQSSHPGNLINLDGKLLFSTYDFDKDYFELWRSDGTDVGTILVNPGSHSSVPQNLLNVKSTLYFTAFDPLYGQELWKSDGTEMGTILVKDITPGIESSSISQMVAVNDFLFFLTNQGSNGYALWRSDGTADGTFQIAPDLIFGADGLTAMGNELFLNINGQLYKVNETGDKITLLSPKIQNPSNLKNVNGLLFYIAYSSNYTAELWKSNGTPQGTVLVSSIPISQEFSMISNSVSVNNTLFFTISNFYTGHSKLWKSDGTTEGTAYVKDIYLEAYQIYKMNPVNVKGNLFFSAKTQSGYFNELWKSDGTEAGTVRVAPEKVYNPENLIAMNGALFFKAFDFIYGTQIFKSDGTETGTLSVSMGKVTLPYYSIEFAEVNNTLFFTASDIRSLVSEELWQTDGTPEGTLLVKDIYAGSNFSRPNHLTNANGKLFFVADDGITGKELWQYDPVACILINNEKIIVDPVDVCVGNNATLIINNSQPGVSYKTVLSGNPSFPANLYPFGEAVQGGGNISLILPTANLAPGTYTTEIYASGCTEQKLPNSVTITVNALPVTPTALPVTIYAGEQATLTVTNAPVGYSFKWYTQATDGTAISGATSASYVTPVLTASATYYVAIADDCGESERTAIAVTVIGSPCTASGTILREVWEEVPGTNLNIVPFHAAPSLQSQLTLFEAPSNTGNNYGQRIRGYICPPQSGHYTFWIAGDDNCELWLSTNDDPATKTRIAHITGTNAWTGIRIWDRYSSQRSAPVYLQAGQKYYIEALHKEGIGSDNLAVGWQLPDNTLERPISGQRLSPYVPYGKGTLMKETWANVMGNEVSQIPLQTEATTIQEITSFEAPSNIANNYGQRIRGYVHPPVSGDYTFWLSGDDNCELWLSANDDPATKTRIAYISGAAKWTYPRQWNRFSSQKSEKVTLVAGRKYYVEVLHKESIGSDHVAVGWQLPDYSLERPVPGIRLSPFAFDGQERLAAEQGAQTNSFSLELYPNPSLGEKVFIQSKGLDANEKVEIILYNGVGNVIATHSLQADESGGLFDEISFAQKLPAGMYTLMLQSASQTSTRKLVITR